MGVKILGIETSCDETAAAVVEDGVKILSSVVSSQVDVHRKFGGVVPEVASRRHLELINPVIKEALEQAGVGFGDLQAVAVTQGPGLVGALLVGLAAAKALAFALGVPLLAVNHLEGHIYANFLVHRDLSFPLVCLVVSGGHTDLVLVRRHGDYRLLGRTRDDAAGEAFDKVARVLELGYPGGPALERLAREGNEEAVNFPRASVEGLDFSFSGLKTAVIQHLHRCQRAGEEVARADVAASFQKAVVDVLVEKTLEAARRTGCRDIILAGGVAANGRLRAAMQEGARREGRRVLYPPAELCTDNAAMIACAAYYRYLRGEEAPLTLNALPGLPLAPA
ncbi:tRNA (adenosine(37)-N6)-threonylcarbamoyltransferase complex transferase subunit TsaD [Desulfovirgula thermocuniculi]|uniref:tRNA (adenosine(37)-N6)-threonylcarbamoyltransferase complex transferase subunit TsaD n=1 Tax=Desulfovirgula thermocuniculi TaxID=348842 RepID=UPI00041ABC18|nr:tRNA (adenosine(37)-N6)-threonylcarbamoyltransferase complex transferase subunit TsaD [Desulfovirgula thermocuniculi]